MLYETYSYNFEDSNNSCDQESYEISGYDGARISKLAQVGKFLVCKYDEAKTMVEVLERGFRISGDGPCVGWRNFESKYSWITYSELINRAKNFGSGLMKLGIILNPSSFVCIYAQNSVEWLVSQYGCFYYSAIVVPLYDSIGPDSRSVMITNVEAKIVVCDVENRVKDILQGIEETPSLTHIVSINDVSEEIIKLAKEKGIELHLFQEIEETGKLHKTPVKLPKPTDTALICYTSGTTGTPKGAMLSHKSMIAGISGVIETMGDLKPSKDDVAISYLPLAHVFEQAMQISMFLNGGRIGFFSGDISRLTDDMRVLQPTIMAAVPRVLNKIYDKVEASMSKLSLNIKQNEETVEKDSQKVKEIKYDPKLFKPILDSLGCKLRLIICGSAPVSEKVLSFYRLALSIDVMEVYGQTESCGPIAVNVVSEKSVGTVGPPLPCCMVKLENVPELEYFKENKIGEICVKGPVVFKGYHKDPEKTSQIIDEEGWLHTGDIGKWEPCGVLKIINRKKHIFKLAQGEFVIPEKIETIYQSSPFVSQIFVDGDSLKEYLVAVVIPDQNETTTWCEKNSIQDNWDNICKNPVVKQNILDDMHRFGKSAGLLSFQQVKEIYLHPQLLTVQEGHLTPTQKIKRELVRKLFLKEIQSMYNTNSICK